MVESMKKEKEDKFDQREKPCPACGGMGMIAFFPCPRCYGSGVIEY
jgi:DnaJ-class molecular chaperone